jgi:hypothetical protein
MKFPKPKTYKVEDKQFDCWTEAQDEAVRLLNEGQELVEVLIWSEKHDSWGMLQELNLERGIEPVPGSWNTHVLAPYYWNLRYENT